ncbi:hypothetical protein PV10_06627 [Exophiala mesophila]|uniref:BTB domain-containing protein n=1 Tax=Exophiala mesophila TaxID=212818 RepID=A0A0D1XV76_EXOME|nr:uncharacterized protein PV10_06627 [Exophiala mesophila]KIV92166.1 hypothetical protein PV10_06627 [Exophiala mesophila]
MSHSLWQSLFQDDVDTFRQYLASATYSTGPQRLPSNSHTGATGLKLGSPGSLATSPKTPFRSRKSHGHTTPGASSSKNAGIVLTRAEVNARDIFGRSILHHAASSQSENALEFVKALLEIPFLDLYAQDAESGWTALHRALYHGNIAIAKAIMVRDLQAATDFTINTVHTHAGGLVKIKDHEGNSPFEVFGLTIAPRSIDSDTSALPSGIADDDSVNGVDYNDDGNDNDRVYRGVIPTVNLEGDDVYAFGSNKNLSLGLGDEDDRQFPGRVQLTRPEHLAQRLHEDLVSIRRAFLGQDDQHTAGADTLSFLDLPAVVRHKPITIQNVVMAKLHTAILTDDPFSNLHMCGYGPGGRLGTGDEVTRFTYQCIQGGGLAKRRICCVALGQDHSIAVTSEGEVFSWGSNRFGQLGYALPESTKTEAPIQLIPRQLFGYIKKELVIGAAASAIHSAIYTSNAVYTFGKNEGQLGFMDADARSLEAQFIPRRIGVSILQHSIKSVSAIDRATAVLMENHDVVVFTHYGFTKVSFDLESFTNYYMADNLSAMHNRETNYIKQISGGGHTLCAMSSYGEVYTIDVPQVSETAPSNMSTTNPTKARNALPKPTKVWSIRKDHMSAIDVAVGQYGSVILCTAAGSVWRKEKRANIKAVNDKSLGKTRQKDYKFVRIPHLTNAVAVRSNAYGAFAAVRKDSMVTRQQIIPAPASLWEDLFPHLPFHNYGHSSGPNRGDYNAAQIARAIIAHPDAESDIITICQRQKPLSQSQYDLWITSNVTDARFPVHSFLLKARSPVLRSALTEFSENYYYSIPELMSIEYDHDGDIQIKFQGADFLTLANFVFYLYTESVIDVWHYTSQALQSAPRYRSVRLELMKISSQLELRHLERAVRVMTPPARCLNQDMELAILDPDFYSDADVVIELAGGAELPAHSVLLCTRCPFFNGLFHGRARGRWVSSRKEAADEDVEAVRVDLKHLDRSVFSLLLRHLYADTGAELFDDISTSTIDEFLDVVIEVMSAANELMLDRLTQICQEVVGKYVTVRNVCSLLNTISECSVDNFKLAALEYICLNLECMLELKLLDELDEDLLIELDDVVQANQLSYSPFARSGRAEDELMDIYPELPMQIEISKRRRIDSMRLRSRLVDDEDRFATTKHRVGSLERQSSSPLIRGPLSPEIDESPDLTPSPSPAIFAQDEGDDLPFNMDEDNIRLPGVMDSHTTAPGVKSGSGNALSKAESRPSLAKVGSSYRGDEQPTLPASPRTSGLGISRSPVMATVPVSGFSALAKVPWQKPDQASPKTDLKDIMAQASASRVSNLTQAMQNLTTSSKGTSKLSQKERKRQQQQIAKDMESRPVGLTRNASGSGAEPAPSPWQMISKAKPAASSPPVQPMQNGSGPRPLKQSMTMRQTIAGGQASSTDSAVTPKRAPPSIELASTSQSTPPQIQSIRHTPLPPRRSSAFDARTSMSEILAQQQIEKSVVKEAAAKRSLQDIQQEQEFQEWWDNESRRVQEQDANDERRGSRRGKGARGSSGPRRGGGRGGKGVKPTSEGQETYIQTATTERGPGEGRNNNGARGHTRGRGRGHMGGHNRGSRQQTL